MKKIVLPTAAFALFQYIQYIFYRIDDVVGLLRFEHSPRRRAVQSRKRSDHDGSHGLGAPDVSHGITDDVVLAVLELIRAADILGIPLRIGTEGPGIIGEGIRLVRDRPSIFDASSTSV